MGILTEIDDGAGYCLEQLSASELSFVRGVITDQFLERICALQSDLVETAREKGIGRYHELPIVFEHGKSWPKATRLLDARFVQDFSCMGFFQRIRQQVGPSAVISHDELNWRLVRPHEPGDVGPIHADKWFWDAGYGYGSMPTGFDRFKVWMAIHTEPGSNGLCVKPDSHRQTWKHHFEMKEGVRKPVLDEDPNVLGMQLLPLGAGQMVIFHDELLHGGVINRGSLCRVSLELTVLYDRAEALDRKSRESASLAVA